MYDIRVKRGKNNALIIYINLSIFFFFKKKKIYIYIYIYTLNTLWLLINYIWYKSNKKKKKKIIF